LAALATLGGVGLGQLYNAQAKKAAIFYITAITLLTIRILPIITFTFIGSLLFILIGVLFLIWSMIDAFRCAKRSGEIELRPYNKWYVYAILIVLNSAVVGPVLQSVVFPTPAKTFKILSGSMIPYLRIEDYVVSNLQAYSKEAPKRGDLIVYKRSDNDRGQFVHRVVGLPGEQLEIRNRIIYINGQALEDSWAYHIIPEAQEEMREPRDVFAPVVIPPDSFFVLGDNRENSIDSRVNGFVERSKIISKLVFIYWSKDLSRIGLLL